MKNFPDYVDEDGVVWTYGLDGEGNLGYHVEGGFVFPFESDISGRPAWDYTPTFEWAKKQFNIVPVEARYCVVTRDDEQRQRVYGPFPEEKAEIVRSLLWDEADDRAESLSVEIIMHETRRWST